MAIRFNKYIDITSGVGAASIVNRRDLVGRFFSDNVLIPPGSFISFDTADEVGSYFTTTSQEYQRAVFYFGWISKNVTKAQSIQFARWVDTAVAPRIYGAKGSYSASEFTSIANGSFQLGIDGTLVSFTGVDFTSGVTTLADVASKLQTEIRASMNAQFATATVTYDATNTRFDFVGSSAVAAILSVAPGIGGTDISGLIGWYPVQTNQNGVLSANGSIVANGSGVETITACLINSAAVSDNFGSFCLIPTTVTEQNVIDAATWNNSQNVKYMFSQGVSSANYVTWSAALANIGGVGLTLSNTVYPAVGTQYPEQEPMMIFAATNYSASNSVQNYMFQIFNLVPEVTTDALSDALDAARVNYYGQTQSAGQFLSFYQRGVLFGISTDPLDMNTYANEIWLKDAIGAAIMTLLLSLSKISANSTGRGQLISVIQSIINLALNNGTISVGKSLSITQQLYITTLTNDPLAWQQVQNIGYWLNVTFELIPDSDPAQYQAVYTLIYSKDDDIRKVIGSDILI
jgi:hypothetical protein